MYRFSLKTALFLLGFLWLLAGVMLFTKGVTLLQHPSTFFSQFSWMPKKELPILLLCLGLFLGQFKARTVLRKAANKRIEEMRARSAFSFFQVFNLQYFLLIVIMSSLGMLLNFLSTPSDLRGFIDITIGTALMQSSFFYFKATRQPKTNDSSI